MTGPTVRRHLTTAEARIAQAAAMPETELQENVRSIALSLGLLYHHPYDSRRSYAGLPDCVIAGPGGLLFAELKSAKGRVTADQARWIEALTPHARVRVWRPVDLLDGTIARELAALRYAPPPGGAA